ncbi:MAG: winged helix-turn-helix domain-containing protein [Actinomycetota bacterium]|nr:winged helix-turn-helix domain-containing protein [Actinomycetota bacterium]
MPDQYGFNHLGDSVRCIDCPTGGPIWRWPERKRARHARGHDTGRKQGAADVRRERILLAAPPTDSNEEKEAITMANKATGQGEPAKQVAIDVLRKAGEPLHAKEIAKRVLASGRCAGLKGKTPAATISAMLAVGSKPGGPFARVDKGTYTLADTSTTAKATEQPKRAATKAPRTRKAAQARKTTSRTRTKCPAAKRSR